MWLLNEGDLVALRICALDGDVVGWQEKLLWMTQRAMWWLKEDVVAQ
jgi:hypothetical protein